MKQETTPEQTAKLIELGFNKPNNTRYVQHVKARNLLSPFVEFGEPEFEGSYFIGELIEMLPKTLENSLINDNLSIFTICEGYQVEYSNILGETYFSFNVELINALYEMVVKLKEDRVI